MTADEEDNFIVAQGNSVLNEDGSFASDVVLARKSEENVEVSIDQVDYMDVSPKQIVAVATAAIPFLENDDSNRALMGANMQRQAVPLIDPHAPLIGTTPVLPLLLSTLVRLSTLTVAKSAFVAKMVHLISTN